MTAFHEVKFPDTIAYGAAGGPVYSTTIVSTASGYEERNVNWSASRGTWDVSTGLKTQAQYAELIAFFRARKGKAYGFRFKDWSDYSALTQTIGTGNASLKTFQLVKVYASGSYGESRTISKPVLGTTKIYLGGIIQTSGWSVNTTTGLVTFTNAPGNGVVVTADFDFDVPVRFDTDEMSISIENYHRGSWKSIPIIEIRV